MFEELDDPTPDLRPEQTLPAVRARGHRLRRRRQLATATGAGTAITLVAAAALTLPGGGTTESLIGPAQRPAPSATAPSVVPSPRPTPSRTTPAPATSTPSSSGPSTSAPSTSAPSTPAPSTPAPTASTPPVPTDLPQEVLLPVEALRPPDGPRQVSEGTLPWRLPDACSVGAPPAAVAMRTVQQGDGEFEAPVGVQQVAVHADAAAAQAEATRVAAALQDCAQRAASAPAAETPTRYLVSPSAIGADGIELAVDYYGVTADDPAADGLGYAVVLVRRGTALTLVGAVGGEGSIRAAREEAAGQAQQAWERLCRYQVDGCG